MFSSVLADAQPPSAKDSTVGWNQTSCMFVSTVGWGPGLTPVPPLPEKRVSIVEGVETSDKKKNLTITVHKLCTSMVRFFLIRRHYALTY